MIPLLRQLPVRLQLGAVERERFLVRHREDVRAAAAVREVEELGDAQPAGLLPQLGRRQYGREHLLASDRVHLLADDLDDVLVHLPAERQERPEARAELADEAAAQEEPVRKRLRVGRSLAQGREIEL